MSTVSTIIPAYNAVDFIAAAIESVLAQSRPPAEILVIDDGSTDTTAVVARRFPTVTVHSQQNAGQGAARNRGAELAQGNFLTFLDADDLWTADKLERQLSAMAADPQLQAVFGLADEFQHAAGDDDRPSAPRTIAGPRPAHLPGAMLIRRTAFHSIGPYRTDLTVAEVVDWYGRALHSGLKLETLDHVVLLRRIHSNNLGVRKRDARSDYLKAVKAVLDRRRTG